MKQYLGGRSFCLQDGYKLIRLPAAVNGWNCALYPDGLCPEIRAGFLLLIWWLVLSPRNRTSWMWGLQCDFSALSGKQRYKNVCQYVCMYYVSMYLYFYIFLYDDDDDDDDDNDNDDVCSSWDDAMWLTGQWNPGINWPPLTPPPFVLSFLFKQFPETEFYTPSVEQ